MSTKKMALFATMSFISLTLFFSIVVSLKIPYGVYQFLKLSVFLTSCYFAYDLHNEKKVGPSLIFIGLAILYNPIFPLHLTKSIWTIINIATVSFFGTFSVKIK